MSKSDSSTRRLRSVSLTVLFLAAGCSGVDGPSSSDNGLAGAARFAITAPSSIQNVGVTFKGQTRQVTRCIPVDGTTTTLVQGLPTNSVQISASAYSGTTCSGDPIWVADPQTVQLVAGQEVSIQLVFRPNGEVMLGTTFSPDMCSNPVNVAAGANPSASDDGWGGGTVKTTITDGLTSYCDTWAHGLAFTGGPNSWDGQLCGWRQATLDLGKAYLVNRALYYHHGKEHIPAVYKLEGSLDSSTWFTISDKSSVRDDLADYPTNCWGSTPTEHLFDAVTVRYVRYSIDNCQMMFPTDGSHGWLYEIELWGCASQ